MKLEQLDLPMLKRPLETVVTAGQPTAADLASAKAAGIRRIINLRPPAEDHGYDEAAEAARLGLDYTVIPVANPGDLNLENTRALDAALAKAGDEPTLVHCATSNRVGALLALRASWLQGKSEEEALALGRAGGMTKHELIVKLLLQRGPEAPAQA